MVQSHVGRCMFSYCILCLSRASQLFPTPLGRQWHWLLSQIKNKWGGMTSCSLLMTPRTITVTGKLVCMNVRTSFRSLQNHLSFLQFTFWSWSKFFSSEKNQIIPLSWCFNLLNKCFIWIKLFSCHICINWPLHILLNLSTYAILLMVHFKTLRAFAMALMDFLEFLSIISWDFHRHLCVVMVLGPYACILCLTAFSSF